MRNQLIKTYNNMYKIILKNKNIYNNIEKIQFKSKDTNKKILEEINNLIGLAHYPEYYYLSQYRFKSTSFRKTK